MVQKSSRRPLIRLLCLSLALFFPASSYADLDVGIPPGNPWDWFLPSPSSVLRVPTSGIKERVATSGVQKKATGNSEKNKTVTRDRGKRYSTAKEPRKAAPTRLTATTMDLLEIITIDIFGELGIPMPGELPNSPKRPRGKRPTSQEGFGLGPIDKKAIKKVKWGTKLKGKYPPAVTEDLILLGMTGLLRKFFHPNTMLESQLIEFLAEIGVPSLIAFDYSIFVTPKTRVAEVVKAVQARVSPLPSNSPRPLKSKDPEEAMLLRLVAKELSASYSHSLYNPLCRYSLALPPSEVIPVFEAYLHPHAHPLLQQNVVAVLASYRGKDLSKPLFEALQQCSDPVARDRALKALARKKSDKILPIVKSLASSKDIQKRCLALTLMIELGHKDGWQLAALTLDKYLSKLKITRTTLDEFQLAIQLLGTVKGDAALSTEILKKALAKCRLIGASLNEDAGKRPDVPDPADLRGTVLTQLALISLAGKGDTDALKELVKIWEATPATARRLRSQIAAVDTFGAFEAPTLVFLIKSLPSMGNTGIERLRVIVKDTQCRFPLRAQALQLLDAATKIEKATILELLKDGDPRIRSAAMRLAAQMAPDDAKKAAKEWIDGFLTLQLAHKSVTVQELDATSAFETLRILNVVPLAELIKAFKKARKLELYRIQNPPAKKKKNALGIGFKVYQRASPLLPVIVNLLGDFNDDQAQDALAEYLEQGAGHHRGQAALILAGTSRGRSLKALVKSLKSQSGWLRYCSYRALRVSGPNGSVDYFCDWIFASKGKRHGVAAKYKSWLRKQKIK
ncbi:MAG: HEAT repeat domain-containing protein [Planctomycetota bacterium]|nr:HEAT repeat domain-containing protein [Planctomycetota bacterium]